MLTAQNTSPSTYSLLPPQEEGWRQVLIFPTVEIGRDGVSLNKNTSSYILWIELASRKVWGLKFSRFKPFISFRILEMIALRLETAHPENFDAILVQLATLAGWRKAESVGLSDMDVIAVNLVKDEVPTLTEKTSPAIPDEDNSPQAAYPHKAAYVEGLMKFKNNLDADAVKLITNEPILSSDAANWYNYLIHPVAKLESYRRQAMQSFPLLRNAFCSTSKNYRYRRLQQSVDSGNPLLPVLLDFFPCPMPVARFLVGKEYALVGEEWCEQLDQMVDILSMLKPDYWPCTQEDWQNFNSWILPVYTAYTEYYFQLKLRKYPKLMSDWLNNLAKGGYAQIPVRLKRLGITLIDIITIPDFANEFSNLSYMVCADRHGGYEALWQHSILKIAVLSHRWHDWLLNQTNEKEDTYYENISSAIEWESFINKPWQYYKFMVVPLNNSEMLRHEGKMMQHCVGSFTYKCALYGAHIFSIRDLSTGKSLSTVELSVHASLNNKDEILVVQHYGYNNLPPTKECEQALNAFLRYLKKTVTREQFNELYQQLHKRREKMGTKYSPNDCPGIQLLEFRRLLQGYPLLENFVWQPVCS